MNVGMTEVDFREEVSKYVCQEWRNKLRSDVTTEELWDFSVTHRLIEFMFHAFPDIYSEAEQVVLAHEMYQACGGHISLLEFEELLESVDEPMRYGVLLRRACKNFDLGQYQDMMMFLRPLNCDYPVVDWRYAEEVIVAFNLPHTTLEFTDE